MGMYLIAFFISPLYFLIRKKWGSFAINLILYILSLATILVFGLGIIFWGLGVAHAFFHLRKELMMEHATMIAEQMAKQMSKDKG